MVFEALSKKELSATQLVTVSTRAWKVPAGSSKMFLEPGSKVSVDDLLRGLMIQSGNDAAIALAEAVSGSVEAFVARMNDTAAKLGEKGYKAGPETKPDDAGNNIADHLGIRGGVGQFKTAISQEDSRQTQQAQGYDQKTGNRAAPQGSLEGRRKAPAGRGGCPQVGLDGDEHTDKPGNSGADGPG